MSGLTLTQPFWLLLLPLPWLLRPWLQRRHGERLSRLIAPRLWPLLIRPRPSQGPGAFSRRFLAAWALALLAASGPQLTGQEQAPQPRSAIDLVLVVDISPSMAVNDIAPSRLERAKFELRDLFARLQGTRLALVVYSAQAYRLLPLTSDNTTLAHFVAALDTGLTRRHGSNLTMALETASELLQDSPAGSRAVLLLSDGEVHDPDSARAAARRLGRHDIPLLIMGLGTPGGGPVYDAHGRFLQYEGQAVISRLDGTLLKDLARLSGGRYTPLRDDDSDWDVLQTAMARLTPYSREAAPAPQATLLYPGLLAASLLLFLSGGLRLSLPRPLPALLLLACLLLPLSTPQAGPWQQWQAYRALESGDYQDAARRYEALMGYRGALGKGVAAYRQGHWRAALNAFREAGQLARTKEERAGAAYNTGTTLLRLGDLEAANQALKEALRWQPHHKGASINLGLIEEARRTGLGNDARREQANASRLSDGGRDFLPEAGGTAQFRGKRNGARSSTTAIYSGSLRPAVGEADTTLIVRLHMAEQEAAFEALPEDKPW
ncbi:MAG: VWA domain-containing protein [Gammaproteobacteria bacterium]